MSPVSKEGRERRARYPLFSINCKFIALVTEPDDPSSSLIHDAMVRICHTLGPDFVPFLTFIIPPLLRAAEATDILVTESIPLHL